MSQRTILLLAAWTMLSAMLVAAGPAAADPALALRDVNLRTGPGTNFPAVLLIPGGSTVDVRSCSGEWCQVTFAGRVGFSNMAFFDFGDDEPVPVYPGPPAPVYPGSPVPVYPPGVLYDPPAVYDDGPPPYGVYPRPYGPDPRIYVPRGDLRDERREYRGPGPGGGQQGGPPTRRGPDSGPQPGARQQPAVSGNPQPQPKGPQPKGPQPKGPPKETPAGAAPRSSGAPQ